MLTTRQVTAAAVLLALGVLGASADLRAQGMHEEKPLAQAVKKSAAISPDQFDPLVKLILPAAERGETKWLAISWMTNTLEARKKAAAEDKPLVVWSMSA